MIFVEHAVTTRAHGKLETVPLEQARSVETRA
jgi:hypothetical protein